MSAHVSYDPVTVALSVLIAIAAATAALWFAGRVTGALKIGAAALLMGVAVSGMHYTGMLGMSVEPHHTPGPVGARRASTSCCRCSSASPSSRWACCWPSCSPPASGSSATSRSTSPARLSPHPRDGEGAPDVDYFGTPRG
ncbi:MHYT domain-containing protein [Nonomuraea ferruginea]